jgi:hypothetical protein
MNCGDAPTEPAARAKAEKIAKRGKREIRFVDSFDTQSDREADHVRATTQAARQERLLEADGPDSDDRRATSCSHYGEHVPEDFTGCARCLLAQECYDEYVKRAREVA